MSVAATLLCLVGLYRLEYCYDLTDTAEMKEIIREDLVSISGFPYHGEVDVLETATVKDRMLFCTGWNRIERLNGRVFINSSGACLADTAFGAENMTPVLL